MNNELKIGGNGQLALSDHYVALEIYKLAVEHASDHIIITDNKGIILSANDAASKITGYTNNEMIGTKAGKLWGGLMDKAFYKRLWNTLLVDKKPFFGEINNRRKNGVMYVADVHIAPVLNKQHEVEFIVGIEHDITKQKEVDQMKTEFISLASHQLRTPITSVSWGLQTLLGKDSENLRKEQVELLETIYKSNKNMQELVTGFLDATKLESEEFAPEKGEVDLPKVAEKVLEMLAGEISDKKITVVKNFGKEIPHLDIGEKVAVLIFQNLLSNAVRYTPEGGRVELSMEQSGENVTISVKDNGIGIPEEVKNQIFTKLFRAGNAKEVESQGTGLGLYMLKMYVDKMGGKVWFESQEERGVTFFVRLPQPPEAASQ